MKKQWRLSPDQIRKAREARGLTQMALASKVPRGTPQQVGAWEKNGVMTMKSFLALCNALDAPPKTFFELT